MDEKDKQRIIELARMVLDRNVSYAEEMELQELKDKYGLTGGQIMAMLK